MAGVGNVKWTVCKWTQFLGTIMVLIFMFEASSHTQMCCLAFVLDDHLCVRVFDVYMLCLLLLSPSCLSTASLQVHYLNTLNNSIIFRFSISLELRSYLTKVY